jgi:hypothetical protein
MSPILSAWMHSACMQSTANPAHHLMHSTPGVSLPLCRRERQLPPWPVTNGTHLLLALWSDRQPDSLARSVRSACLHARTWFAEVARLGTHSRSRPCCAHCVGRLPRVCVSCGTAKGERKRPRRKRRKRRSASTASIGNAQQDPVRDEQGVGETTPARMRWWHRRRWLGALCLVALVAVLLYALAPPAAVAAGALRRRRHGQRHAGAGRHRPLGRGVGRRSALRPPRSRLAIGQRRMDHQLCPALRGRRVGQALRPPWPISPWPL